MLLALLMVPLLRADLKSEGAKLAQDRLNMVNGINAQIDLKLFRRHSFGINKVIFPMGESDRVFVVQAGFRKNLGVADRIMMFRKEEGRVMKQFSLPLQQDGGLHARSNDPSTISWVLNVSDLLAFHSFRVKRAPEEAAKLLSERELFVEYSYSPTKDQLTVSLLHINMPTTWDIDLAPSGHYGSFSAEVGSPTITEVPVSDAEQDVLQGISLLANTD